MSKTAKKYHHDQESVIGTLSRGDVLLTSGNAAAHRLSDRDTERRAHEMTKPRGGDSFAQDLRQSIADKSSAASEGEEDRAPMELKCKRCQHIWDYRGRKIPIDHYPLYVTCPRCRTVVKLESKTLRDKAGSPNPPIRDGVKIKRQQCK